MKTYTSSFPAPFVVCGSAHCASSAGILRDAAQDGMEALKVKFEEASGACANMLSTLPTLEYPLSDEEQRKMHAVLDNLIELQRVLKMPQEK